MLENSQIEDSKMDYVKLNAILMHMGGGKCRKSHLMKKGFCTANEIDQMIHEGYLIEDGEIVYKTEKAKKIF